MKRLLEDVQMGVSAEWQVFRVGKWTSWSKLSGLSGCTQVGVSIPAVAQSPAPSSQGELTGRWQGKYVLTSSQESTVWL